jgi:hypothetical protein
MRSSFASRGGFVLAKTPSPRRQALRRRWTVIGGVLALALAAGVIGSLVRPPATAASSTEPFSYISSQ